MKRSIIFSTSLIVLASFGFLGFKCLNTNPSATKAAAENPAALNYRTYCAGCHGDNLEKFTAKKWMDEPGNASVINSIKMGIESQGMPSFQKTFTETEIEELAAYVKKGIPEDKSSLKPAVIPGGVMESEVQDFIVDTVVTGLDVPWGLAFLPNGDLLISERAGTLASFFRWQTLATHRRFATYQRRRTRRIARLMPSSRLQEEWLDLFLLQCVEHKKRQNIKQYCHYACQAGWK